MEYLIWKERGEGERDSKKKRDMLSWVQTWKGHREFLIAKERGRERHRFY